MCRTQNSAAVWPGSKVHLAIFQPPFHHVILPAGSWPQGIRLMPRYVYLSTKGRKTGLQREIEIWFVEKDGRVYILAEHGYKAHWVQNILESDCHLAAG